MSSSEFEDVDERPAKRGRQDLSFERRLESSEGNSGGSISSLLLLGRIHLLFRTWIHKRIHVLLDTPVFKEFDTV